MPTVRELGPDETGIAYDVLAELRPDIGSRDQFVDQVNDVQRAEGYRVVASFESDASTPAAVAGFRTGHSLAWGHYLYVDDLVTTSEFRKRGHAGALMNWLIEEAQQLGCDQLHLDSGTQRHGAHRFYLNQRLAISSFHFTRLLKRT